MKLFFLVASADESNRRDYIKCLVEGQIIGSLKTLLSDSAFASLRHTAAQLLAEIAKTGQSRRVSLAFSY